MDGSDWNLKLTTVVCRQLDCGSVVSIERASVSTDQPVWKIESSCVGSESSLRECATKVSQNSTDTLKLICSGNTNNDIKSDSIHYSLI